MTSFFEELWARSVPKLRKLKRGKPYRYCTGIDLLIQIAKVSVTCLFCHCTLATAYSCKIFPQTWTAPCTTPYQHSLPHPGQQPGQHLALNSMLDTVSTLDRTTWLAWQEGLPLDAPWPVQASVPLYHLTEIWSTNIDTQNISTTINGWLEGHHVSKTIKDCAWVPAKFHLIHSGKNALLRVVPTITNILSYRTCLPWFWHININKYIYIFWDSFWHIFLAGKRSRGQLCKNLVTEAPLPPPPGWGPALPTQIWSSQLKSRSAHWDLELAVLSGISSDILSAISVWHIFWHSFWHSISHIFWHSF